MFFSFDPEPFTLLCLEFLVSEICLLFLQWVTGDNLPLLTNPNKNNCSKEKMDRTAKTLKWAEPESSILESAGFSGKHIIKLSLKNDWNCPDSPLLLQFSLLFFVPLHQFLQQLHPPHHCWRTPEFHWCPFSSSEEHPWCWEMWLPPVALERKGPWLYLICSIHSHKAFFISFPPPCKSQHRLKCNESSSMAYYALSKICFWLNKKKKKEKLKKKEHCPKRCDINVWNRGKTH